VIDNSQIDDGFSNPPSPKNIMTKIPCYLRTLRREWGMSQKELAGLMLRGDRSRVSGVERNLVAPNAAEIVAYSVLFGMPPAELFPAFYDQVEEGLIERAYALDEHLQRQKDTYWTARKRKLLRFALDRATGKKPNPLRP
jgi:transcriptional regulator with XRE-family HTH domain